MEDKNYNDLSELVGKRVVRRNTVIFENENEGEGEGEGEGDFSEVGVIVHAWNNSEADSIDCYVAFFGEEWPSHNEKPEQKPYVLRYFLSSLEEVR